MEEGDVLVPKPCTMAPLWVQFGFRPYDKGGPSNVEEAICKICCIKVQVKCANLTILKNHLLIHHPLQYSELVLVLQKVIKLLIFIFKVKKINNIIDNVIVSQNYFLKINHQKKFLLMTALGTLLPPYFNVVHKVKGS